MSEQDLVKAIIHLLQLYGCWAIRVNSGKRLAENKDGSKRLINLAPAGTPDILACYRGRLIAIEVKLPGNKPTQIQLDAHARIKEAGGIVLMAYDADEVNKFLGGLAK
jgi:Holliday junction resolvase